MQQIDFAAHQHANIDRRLFLQATAATALLTAGNSFFGSFATAEEHARAADDGSQLFVHSKMPMNAEPPLDALVESWMTPVERFYVRSHAPVPKIDTAQFRVSIEGLVERPLQLSLAELNCGFQHVSIVATMTCAGNRRSEHSLVKPVKGVPWREGAIGNARWGGVRLSDVLKQAGLRDSAKHVWFEGLDQIERSGGTIPFGGSIPIQKALDDTQAMPGALLTTQMNGKPLTPDHGFPLRLVVPGYIGARSVKWLGRIVVSDRPSPNHYVATAYKLVEQGTKLEWAESGPIYRYPINSVICTPATGGKLQAGKAVVAGYALPPGHAETTIARVEVSANGGRTWTRAKLTSAARQYCWQLWKAEVPVTPRTTELLVKATDSHGHTQPATVDWNLKGYLFNAPHRVQVDVGG
jgi:sulfite oxidase